MKRTRGTYTRTWQWTVLGSVIVIKQSSSGLPWGIEVSSVIYSVEMLTVLAVRILVDSEFGTVLQSWKNVARKLYKIIQTTVHHFCIKITYWLRWLNQRVRRYTVSVTRATTRTISHHWKVRVWYVLFLKRSCSVYGPSTRVSFSPRDAAMLARSWES